MSTTEDTSAIDEKKTEETTITPNFTTFLSNYLYSIIFTIGVSVFFVGTLGLYTTKVAQANILPDNIEMAPYTVIDRIVQDIPISINVTRPNFWSENKETLSQKAIFNSQEYLDSFNDSFLCSLKKNAKPEFGMFANAPLYFSFVYDNIVAKNFQAINAIFFYLSYLPESIVMLLYGFFGIFIWLALIGWNYCTSIFFHFINIPQLFRSVSQDVDDKWETNENISFFRIVKLLLLFIWVPIGIFSTFVSPFFIFLYTIFSPLYATYGIKQTTNKPHTVFDFIKDTFVYKKFFFFILATLSLLSNGMNNLGTNSIIGILIAIVFAYIMGLYANPSPESGINGFTPKIRQNIIQAPILTDLKNLRLSKVKVCNTIPIYDPKTEDINDTELYRELTKPKKVGGDVDDTDIELPVVKPVPPAINPAQTISPVINPAQTISPAINPSQIISPVINPATEPTTQSGGKKHHFNKKTFNVRLV